MERPAWLACPVGQEDKGRERGSVLVGPFQAPKMASWARFCFVLFGFVPWCHHPGDEGSEPWMSLQQPGNMFSEPASRPRDHQMASGNESLQ